MKTDFIFPDTQKIVGVTDSSAAFLVAQWISRQPSCAQVLICADPDTASQFAEQLSCFLKTVFNNESKTILEFPTWERSIYSPITPSMKGRFERIRVLGELSRGNPVTVVTTLAAFCQATLPREVFERYSLTLAVGSTIESREALGAKLIQSGYLNKDPVEDQGTYALRGDMVDVFPVGAKNPVRIELFGDEVERIREFNPENQRTHVEELPAAEIPPAREVLINGEFYPILRRNLKTYADGKDVQRAIRDPVLESFHDGIYPDHHEGWVPFVYDGRSSLLDYLTPETPVLWFDTDACLDQHKEFLEKQTRTAESSLQHGLILPEVKTLYFEGKEIVSKLKQRKKILLERFEVGTTQEEPHTQRIGVRGMSDLALGTFAPGSALEKHLQEWTDMGYRILVYAYTQTHADRIVHLFNLHQTPTTTTEVKIGPISEGFRWTDAHVVVLTEREILGTRAPSRSSGSSSKKWSGLQTLSDLVSGDAIVHVDHGIGIYRGLSRLNLSGAASDFIQIEYANKDRLYLPVYRLNQVQKYIGTTAEARLDRLGGGQFEKAKQRVRDAVKKLAFDLVELYAKRSLQKGVAMGPRDADYLEFESKFPFSETPDQENAIHETLNDLESGRVLDRLICGDVGFGKTEVAIRAAFLTVMSAKQVAVMVPTTTLAFQHEQSFIDRFSGYPIRIATISRMKSKKEQLTILKEVEAGKVDILIGTHRLLSKDVRFKDLGLLVVDEEHRFGVEQKEKLKAMKVNTHVLAMSATPIPRTLHMSLSGLRDISMISTPPVDRLPIRTYISQFDDKAIREAIQFELARGGQIFFIHNRVQTLGRMHEKLSQLVPGLRITVAHGQMKEGELEKAMTLFYKKKSDLLLCTTIIEAGLDIPSANTVFIDRADTFGLAQLYQLRGRVGRSGERAYAFLLIDSKPLTEDARARLDVIQRFVELGSGFNIASHDLEIRGGGNLLGAEQSGHIAAVGFDLYTELLEEAIQEMRGQVQEQPKFEPEIKTPFPAFLDEKFIPDLQQRLAFYRRLSGLRDAAQLTEIEGELADRFGALPKEAQNLLWIIRIKALLQTAGIGVLTVGADRITLMSESKNALSPSRVVAAAHSRPKKIQLKPEKDGKSKLTLIQAFGDPQSLFFGLEGFLLPLLETK